MPLLRVRNTKGQRFVELGDEPLTIGRHKGNRLALADDRLSRFHCVIEVGEGGVVKLTDLGSRNGSILNGKKVTSGAVGPGDRVKVGGLVIDLVDPKTREPLVKKGGLKVKELPEGKPVAKKRGKVKVTSNKKMPRAMKMVARPYVESADALSNVLNQSFDDDDLGMEWPKAKESEDDLLRIPGGDEGVGDDADKLTGGISGPRGGRVSGGGDDDAVELEGVELEMGDDEGRDQPKVHRSAPLVGEGGVDATDADDPCEILASIIEATPGAEVCAEDLTLINARGKRVRMPGGKAGDDSQHGVILLHQFLLLCAKTGASDIHIEPKPESMQVRLRVDGMMVDAIELGERVGGRLQGVVKVLGDLDITQKTLMQDGHFSAELGEHRIDYRVSFTPSMYGQKLVVRVLDLSNTPCFVSDLDLPVWMGEQVSHLVKQEGGMLIVCGPTGSGKTTTLYAAIREMDVSVRNVVTIEDPPEYYMEGVTQIPINEGQGTTFSSMLRSVLRQDPDVILLGEIRDAETARIALQSAMTGHLVLTTVHAKDALGTIFRLLDLGVEPYLVASSVNLILAQRLVRKLCDHCKFAARPKPHQMVKMGQAAEGLNKIFFASGCKKCMGTGYVGRQGLFELLTATEELKDVILKSPTMSDLRKALKITLFSSLRDSGYKLVAAGVTSLDEIDRVVGAD